MADHSNDTPELNLVAIDIAKQWNVVLVKDSSGCKRSFKVANTAADHEQLVRFLMALPGQVRIALEPTGDYHRPLAFRLLQAGFGWPVCAIHLRENEFRAKYQRYMNSNPLDPDRKRKLSPPSRPKWLAWCMRSSSTERIISRSPISDFPVDRSLSHGPLRHLDLVDNARTFHWVPTLF